MFSWFCIHRLIMLMTSFSRIQTEVIVSSWKIGNANKTWTRAAVPGLDVLKISFYLGGKIPWISLLLITQHLLVKHCTATNFNLRKWTLWSFPCKKSISTPTEEKQGREGSRLDILIYEERTLWESDKQYVICQS